MTQFYVSSYSEQSLTYVRNKVLKIVYHSINGKNKISPLEMRVLCAMAHDIIILRRDFDGTEFNDEIWESRKINDRWQYPTTQLGKLWIHLISYLHVQISPEFRESSRKQFLENFASKLAKHTRMEESKKVFECRGAGSDHWKKSCRTTGISKGGFNACLHTAHKHGIVYVFTYMYIHI